MNRGLPRVRRVRWLVPAVVVAIVAMSSGKVGAPAAAAIAPSAPTLQLRQAVFFREGDAGSLNQSESMEVLASFALIRVPFGLYLEDSAVENGTRNFSISMCAVCAFHTVRAWTSPSASSLGSWFNLVDDEDKKERAEGLTWYIAIPNYQQGAGENLHDAETEMCDGIRGASICVGFDSI